jgi:tetratricopeptide (TPR) repeat protein
MRQRISKFGIAVLVLAVCAAGAKGQKPPARVRPPIAAATPVSVDGSEVMFTTMCLLYASGFEENVNADNWTTFRAQMREKAKAQKGPAVDAAREFYRKHQLKDAGATLSRYIWFGLVSGPAPEFQPLLRRDELPPEVLQLEGFSEILSNYYVEQNIGALWKQVQTVYNREIERLHEDVSQIVLVCTAYLREVLNPAQERTFTIIVDPLVGRITNVRNYGDHYAIILSGAEDIPTDVVRHAFLHFLLDPLPLMYSHVAIVKEPLFDVAAKAPRMPSDLRDDYFSWFSECLVRAVELKVKRGSPSEREAALTGDDADGYTLVRPLFVGLTGFEKSEPSMKIYFPQLVRGIDMKAELQREATIQFAPARNPSDSEQLTAEEVARRRKAEAPAVTTVPDDQDTIALLTEGERRIAERNPRAAEVSFKSVLTKYPEAARAWYGLGLVALLDHDAERAKFVFGRLTSGDHAATQDPMVLAWSHIYLGRIYGDEGQLDSAKTEFQAALAVSGAPEQAQQAAQKGLGELDTRKPTERP